MSHALSSKSTGKVIEGLGGDASDAAMMYVGAEKPWHKLGTSFATAPTPQEALESIGADFKVLTGPVYDADMKEINGYRRTYRSDNGTSLGIVGMRYEVIDNSEAASIMQTIGAPIDSAGMLFEGQTLWMNAKFKEPISIGGDEILPYIVLKSTHDGTGSLVLKRTPIRTVCQNTLNMAMGGSNRNDLRTQNIKHTRNYDERVRIALKAMELSTEYYRQFELKANELLDIKFSENDFENLMNKLYPIPEGDSKRGIAVAERERSKIITAYGALDLENIRYTGWGAYNAIADYSDHMRELRGENKEANAFLRTFEVTAMKDAALELILAK